MSSMERLTAYLISAGIIAFGIWIVATAALGGISDVFARRWHGANRDQGSKPCQRNPQRPERLAPREAVHGVHCYDIAP
jgi:hypothetical protein